MTTVTRNAGASMQKIQWDQFGSIESVDQLQCYLDGQEYRHTNYFHYSSLRGIDGILGTKTIWISNFNAFNDKAEAKRLCNPELSFALCFSTGINDNLPLWYMYSGLSGCGGRIRLAKNGIARLLDKATYELSERDSNGQPCGIRIPLEQGKTIEVNFRDVLYCGNSSKGNMDLKYNTMTNHKLPSLQKEEINKRFEGFVKSLIWYYEKETRLLIRLIGKAQNYINPEKDYMILLHFDDSVYRRMSVTLGPEVKDKEKELESYKNIRDFIWVTSNVRESAYTGDIEMNLCKKCQHSKEQS